ncbi:triadin-like isoform X6 [Bos indicus x Bos taurus]|nr:triadin-like isoform X6 [Bos indicus x Bos taurus]
MRHLKEEKVPTRKESLQLHNVTKVEKPARISREDSEDVPTSKKAKDLPMDSKSLPKMYSCHQNTSFVAVSGINSVENSTLRKDTRE